MFLKSLILALCLSLPVMAESAPYEAIHEAQQAIGWKEPTRTEIVLFTAVSILITIDVAQTIDFRSKGLEESNIGDLPKYSEGNSHWMGRCNGSLYRILVDLTSPN